MLSKLRIAFNLERSTGGIRLFYDSGERLFRTPKGHKLIVHGNAIGARFQNRTDVHRVRRFISNRLRSWLAKDRSAIPKSHGCSQSPSFYFQPLTQLARQRSERDSKIARMFAESVVLFPTAYAIGSPKIGARFQAAFSPANFSKRRDVASRFSPKTTCRPESTANWLVLEPIGRERQTSQRPNNRRRAFGNRTKSARWIGCGPNR